MVVKVRVKPGAKTNHVEQRPHGILLVHVKAPPIEGRANDAVVALLAAHYGVKRNAVTLKHGASGRDKVFEVHDAARSANADGG